MLVSGISNASQSQSNFGYMPKRVDGFGGHITPHSKEVTKTASYFSDFLAVKIAQVKQSTLFQSFRRALGL